MIFAETLARTATLTYTKKIIYRTISTQGQSLATLKNFVQVFQAGDLNDRTVGGKSFRGRKRVSEAREEHVLDGPHEGSVFRRRSRLIRAAAGGCGSGWVRFAEID